MGESGYFSGSARMLLLLALPHEPIDTSPPIKSYLTPLDSATQNDDAAQILHSHTIAKVGTRVFTKPVEPASEAGKPAHNQ
jgi:hypothetical protein